MSETCRSCGAPIIWAQTAGGKRVPLDAKPEHRFVLLGTTGEVGQLVKTYASHFATCPHAATWRKQGG